ncbi:basic proline-rich protein-like [Ailuropoda melanoleuca]|uniref:basic proline-rich protein-like n=1 Tax=Ailuropoda melanoleuca TaxID=9646 RepID=UPI00149420BD|nr:basic proline-rich protein-like [Ailuropoda melanoleuca]XP_034527278.1 basic proline-rich protein-like [Ailuropoda melanoleuca]
MARHLQGTTHRRGTKAARARPSAGRRSPGPHRAAAKKLISCPPPDLSASLQDPQLWGRPAESLGPGSRPRPPRRPREAVWRPRAPCPGPTVPPAYLQGEPRGAPSRSSSRPLAQRRRPGGLPFLQPGARKPPPLPPPPPPPRRPPPAARQQLPGVGGSRVSVRGLRSAEFRLLPLTPELTGARASGEGRGTWSRPSGDAPGPRETPVATPRALGGPVIGKLRAVSEHLGSRGSQSPPQGLLFPTASKVEDVVFSCFPGSPSPVTVTSLDL